MPDNEQRSGEQANYKRLTRNVLAVVLAGGRGTRLYELTNWRAKPAVYFGGKFRIVDFPLSNCINSGIRKITVLTQYKAHSLLRHLVRGWSHFKKELGEFVEVLPASQRYTDEWYQGTADAVYQNIDILNSEGCSHILILSGDHIYRMDYGEMLLTHVNSKADMTICCMEVPVEEAAGAFGVVGVDESNLVKDFVEKPAEPTPLPSNPRLTYASMGNYIFNTEFLMEQLIEDSRDHNSTHDFGKDLIPKLIKNHRVVAHSFRDTKKDTPPYWRDVGTLDSFWEANMELVSVSPELDLYDASWPFWTYQEQLPPAKFVFNSGERCGRAVNSMISGGCIVSGSLVRNSILFSAVRVHSYSEISESVVLPNVKIGRNCRIHKAIIDRSCEIPEGSVIGMDNEQDRRNGYRVTNNGVVLVTRGMLGQPDGLIA